VTAVITIDNAPIETRVEKDGIQYLNDQPYVFIQTEDGFEARKVSLGRENGRFVEITSGLKAGETMVTQNSFHLKTELEKRRGGDLGHGHAH